MRQFTQLDRLINLEFVDVDSRLSTLERILPIGSMFLWSGVQPPLSYLWCDGTEYAIEEFPTLFSTLENRGGTPSSNSKFKVPNISVGNLRYIIKANQ